ncbi:hypothetical protein VTL71DRAFT_14550 [Oculimacula yallundae]|uniref:LITAF domain-containing protein n=1 Tax=Oculimacula yallundae TaxID=86028 RepID=A0ABR4CKW1_9HELO
MSYQQAPNDPNNVNNHQYTTQQPMNTGHTMQQQQSPGIEMVPPPNYPSATGPNNEKQEYTQPQAQQHQQQQYQQDQQQYQQQEIHQQQGIPQQHIDPNQQKFYQENNGQPQQQFVVGATPGNADSNGNGKPKYQTATPLASLQGGPTPVDCPVCGVREMTRTEFVSGGSTHAWAALCCFCLCLGCIPYMVSSLKDCEHKCGSCGALLACWHRSGRTDVIAHATVPANGTSPAYK